MKLLTLLFVAAATVVQAQSQPAAKPATGKIGYVDVENVIGQLPEYKELGVKIQETRKSMSEKLAAKQQNFETAYTNYMQNAKTMADTTRTRIEGQLQAMDNDIQQFKADAENTFVNTRKLVLGPVYLKLGGVIRQVAAENGYMMVLPYRVGSGELLLHSDANHDLTAVVVKKYLEVNK